MVFSGAASDFSKHVLFLDSSWYSHIALHGYTRNPLSDMPGDAVFAFFPLWPLMIGCLSSLTLGAISPAIAGVFLSWLCLCGFTEVLHRRISSGDLPLMPSRFSLILFYFSPGSWVFATNHTEGLFLLLSAGAMLIPTFDDRTMRRLYAPAAAGLTALTRNQGVLVIVSSLVGVASNIKMRRDLRFVAQILMFILVAGLIYSAWPIAQWSLTGNPLKGRVVQSYWSMATGPKDYLSNALWLSPNNMFRALLFWVGLGTSIHLMRRGPNRHLGFYCLMSLALLPLQGNNFPQAYRFSAVLFPIWFSFGNDFLNGLNRIKVGFLVKAVLICTIFMLVVGGGFANALHYWSQTKDTWPY